MDILHDLIGQLRPPWGQKFKSTLFDQSTLNDGEWNETISAFAFINSCSGTQIHVELVAIDPFDGLKATTGIPCEITLPDSQMGFDKNMWIGFKNAQVVSKDPKHLSIEGKVLFGRFPVTRLVSLSPWDTRFREVFPDGNNSLNGWTTEASSRLHQVLLSRLTLKLLMFGASISMVHRILDLFHRNFRRLRNTPLFRLLYMIFHGTIFAELR